ncbi:hypothetical protein F5J12DRAFT_887942 [Pisolithus orientalis]|uniref:uncharacterized protein n=1 Tax=Pisolithus orientalis TaxID=936130 RepID=UPI00222545C2|nr:uncharacterized protein F5J12DRAFT_887942 [Pisolithus orientalis]KAI6033058.1 hypothetical protein F5J12DRAFT_887942 [Pisolithus orientalis]
MGSSQGEKKKKPQGKGKVMELEEADDKQEVGGEEEELAMLHEGPSGAGGPLQWAEWEQEWQLQAEVHEMAALAFKRMAAAAEWMAEATEFPQDDPRQIHQLAYSHLLLSREKFHSPHHAWAEWAEMRRREDMHKARVAKFNCTGGGWKRLENEDMEDMIKVADEGVEGDNKEEEEVRGEQGGGEGQECGEDKEGREQAMEE